MQESWGAEILDNAKQFNTFFFLLCLHHKKKYIDFMLAAVGSEIRCHIPSCMQEKSVLLQRPCPYWRVFGKESLGPHV